MVSLTRDFRMVVALPLALVISATYGPALRVLGTSFPTDSFPKWSSSVFESIPLTISRGP